VKKNTIIEQGRIDSEVLLNNFDDPGTTTIMKERKMKMKMMIVEMEMKEMNQRRMEIVNLAPVVKEETLAQFDQSSKR
jgi:hypothetical protein